MTYAMPWSCPEIASQKEARQTMPHGQTAVSPMPEEKSGNFQPAGTCQHTRRPHMAAYTYEIPLFAPVYPPCEMLEST